MNHINRIAIVFAVADAERRAKAGCSATVPTEIPQGRDLLRMACRLFLNRQAKSEARTAEPKS